MTDRKSLSFFFFFFLSPFLLATVPWPCPRAIPCHTMPRHAMPCDAIPWLLNSVVFELVMCRWLGVYHAMPGPLALVVHHPYLLACPLLSPSCPSFSSISEREGGKSGRQDREVSCSVLVHKYSLTLPSFGWPVDPRQNMTRQDHPPNAILRWYVWDVRVLLFSLSFSPFLHSSFF